MPQDLKTTLRAKAATSQKTVQGSLAGLDPQTLTSIASAVQAYAATPEGHAALQSAKSQDPEGAGKILAYIIEQTVVGKIAEFIKEYDVLKSISLGFMGQADAFGGVSGTLGAAVDVGGLIDGQLNWAVFAGGGFVEGVDAGIEGSICVGLWNLGIDDISGTMYGIEVDVDDELGFDVVGFGGDADTIKGLINDPDPDFESIADACNVLIIGIDIGADDGVEGDEYQFVSVTVSESTDYDAFQSGYFDYILMMNTLICYDSEGVPGFKDQVHFKIQVDLDDGNDDDAPVYRYPPSGYVYISQQDGQHSTPDNANWWCGSMVKFNSSVQFKIEIQNAPHSITHTVHVSDFNDEGKYEMVFHDDDGVNEVKYALWVELIKKP